MLFSYVRFQQKGGNVIQKKINNFNEVINNHKYHDSINSNAITKISIITKLFFSWQVNMMLW